jgi:hypothetical protein
MAAYITEKCASLVRPERTEFIVQVAHVWKTSEDPSTTAFQDNYFVVYLKTLSVAQTIQCRIKDEFGRNWKEEIVA